MQGSDQAPVLCDDSPLRKTGIRNIVFRDDERLGVTVMKPLLLMSSGSVAPPSKTPTVDRKSDYTAQT